MIITDSPLSTLEVAELPKLTPDSSLAELRKVKSDWLASAQSLGFIDDARAVARYLGEPFEIPGRALWRGWRWQDSDLTLELYEGETHWLPGRKAFCKVFSLVATVGSLRVAYFRQSDDPQDQVDNFFIWGKWTNQIILRRAEASQQARAACQDFTERERRALLAQLLVGVEV